MIVFDLQCSGGHRFEAWFGSSADYDEQRGRGLLACPICGAGDIDKAVMAPAVAAKSNRRSSAVPAGGGAGGEAATPPVPAAAATTPSDAAKFHAAMRALAGMQAKMLENSSWVGNSFADKARAMHYGETPTASIHGTTAPEEARALIEEGIAVAPLPIPVVPPDERN